MSDDKREFSDVFRLGSILTTLDSTKDYKFLPSIYRLYYLHSPLNSSSPPAKGVSISFFSFVIRKKKRNKIFFFFSFLPYVHVLYVEKMDPDAHGTPNDVHNWVGDSREESWGWDVTRDHTQQGERHRYRRVTS